MESSSHIVKYFVKTFISIGKKYRSWDFNVAHHVSIVSRSTIQCHLMKCTPQIVNWHPTTLKGYSIRWDSLDIEGQLNKPV